MDQIPSIGRIVHFRLDEGRSKGEYRPAIIVRVWGDPPSAHTAVQIQVFTDSSNDGLDPIIWKTSRVHGDGEGQWIWPPYVPAKEAVARNAR